MVSVKRLFRHPFRGLVIAPIILLSFGYFYFTATSSDYDPPNWMKNHAYFNYSVLAEEPSDQSQTCILPQFHPFDQSIIKFVEETKPIKCKVLQPPLTWVDHQGLLRFNKSIFEDEDWSEKNLTCTYCEVLRDNSSAIDDNYIFNISKKFIDPTDVSHADFVKVLCKNQSDKMVYYNIHAHIREFPEEKRPRTISNQTYNVLVFGIDSLSRLNAIRKLPKTFRYIKDVMKSFIFRGYQKVGVNTLPNLATVLTGYQPHHEHFPYRPREAEKKPHDSWPFIWKNFSHAGYRTMFAEDDPTFNVFHIMSGGFKDQPTDHYARTFWTAVEDSHLFDKSTDNCFGSHTQHSLHIEYVKQLVEKLQGKKPYFAFSWLTKICHMYLNTVGRADEDILNFLMYINEGGYLENTILFFMSDHGQRFHSIQNTYVGSVENKMPLVTIYLPDRFKKSQPHAVQNLQTNLMRLTSSHDTYCTLLDIYKLSLDSSYETGQTKTRNGISLFGVIPKNRTCSAAGIDDVYCTCQKESKISSNEKNVLSAARFIVDTINGMLFSRYNKQNSCAHLTLKDTKRASLVTHGNDIDDHSYTILKITIEVSPSGGIFEGTVRIVKDKFNILGSIKRLDRNERQSECIKDSELQCFCYCNP